LLRLHVDLFAGLPGMLFLGFMGVLLVISLISGTVLYGYYMRKLPFGTVRSHRSTRIKWLDLHNLLGIATLVWLLVVSITGVINTLSEPIFNRWQATELAAMTAPYNSGTTALIGELAVQQAVDSAYQSEPGMTLSFMAFPGNRFAGPRHFVAFMQGTTPWTSKLLKPLLIDAQTGQVVDRRDLPGYVSALLISQPLHFGDYGGLPLKILWALLDILAIIVLISGLYLWLKKRHLSFEARFRPAPSRTGQYRMNRPLSKRRIWGAPLVLGLTNAIGLIAALLSDGSGDVISWFALSAPIVTALWYWMVDRTC
ncbi:MAG TPA: PepSY domain-containing protein, partial [Armatimonadetes bacterium]|nr:PepSY domain-containing protein [Armatimonadota bacterium]